MHGLDSVDANQVWSEKISESEEFFKFLAKPFRVCAGVVGGHDSTSTGDLYLLKNG